MSYTFYRWERKSPEARRGYVTCPSHHKNEQSRGLTPQSLCNMLPRCLWSTVRPFMEDGREDGIKAINSHPWLQAQRGHVSGYSP